MLIQQSPLKNDTLIRALLRQPVDYTPIWLMRQAGRYLPEYRQLRAHAGNFLNLCKTPALACEVTLQPLARYAFDAAILFSDILTIPDAMGLGLHFTEGEGPRFASPLRDASAIKRLASPDPEQELGYVMAAIRQIKTALQQRVPLIGFAGSPWTLATYMVEGGSSKQFTHIKSLLYSDPNTLHHLLQCLAQAVTDYLTAQIAAGVDVIMLFDTWGGLLTPSAYQQFSLNYMQQIIANLPRHRGQQPLPTIIFTKGGSSWLEMMANSGCDAVGVDWTIDIDSAKQRIGQQVALQGNLDPTVLLGSAAAVEQETLKVLRSFGTNTGHVFNLGHGILPQTPPDNVQVLVETVHRYRQAKQT